MGSTTKDTWPDETPDEVIERVRRDHGDLAADVVARGMTDTPKRKTPPRSTSGVRPKPPAAPSGVPRQDRWTDGMPTFTSGRARVFGYPKHVVAAVLAVLEVGGTVRAAGDAAEKLGSRRPSSRTIRTWAADAGLNRQEQT